MFHALENYMLTTQLFTCSADSKERRAAYRAMWRHIREKDRKLYTKLRYGTYVAVAGALPWKLRGIVSVKVYRKLCAKKKLG